VQCRWESPPVASGTRESNAVSSASKADGSAVSLVPEVAA